MYKTLKRLTACVYTTLPSREHGDAFRRSSPCNLLSHSTATPTPCRGRLQKIPPCWYHMRLQSPVPHHFVGRFGSQDFLHKRLIRRPSMVQCVLIRNHLMTIPPIILVPNNTTSTWDHPKWGHLQITKHYERKRKIGWTFKHPWSRTQRQKTAL